MRRSKEERFGLYVDLLGAAMKGLVLYVGLIMTAFWLYQEGDGPFQPWFSLLILLFTVLLGVLSHNCSGVKLCIGVFIMLLAWTVLGTAYSHNRQYFIGTGVLAAAESMFQKLVKGRHDKDAYSGRFRMQGMIKWGIVLMGFLSVWLIVHPVQIRIYDSLEPMVCQRYMLGAFGLYLLLAVWMRYSFLYYDYFRTNDSIGADGMKRLRRANGIVTAVSAVLIVLGIFCANETIVKICSWIVLHVLGGLLAGAWFGLSQMQVNQLAGEPSVPESAIETASRLKVRPASQFPVEEAVVLLLIVGVILLLVKIYKSFTANYSIGNEEAVYMAKQEQGSRRAGLAGAAPRQPVHFTNDNRGKIRKVYYRMMNARMDRYELRRAKRSTPAELIGLYGKEGEEEKLRDMTQIYEKARYSNEDCTDKEVQKMKNRSDGDET